AASNLDDQTTDDGGINLDIEVDVLAAGHGFQSALERLKIAVVQLFRDGNLRSHFALVLRNEGAKGADHVADCEQPPIGCNDFEEVGGQSLDVRFGENGRQGLELLIGIKCRTADKTIEIGTLRYERIKLIEILFDGIDGLVVECELEKSGGVAASHSRDDRIFACHSDARCLRYSQAAVAGGRHKPLEFKREFRCPGTSQELAGTP